MIDTIKSGPRVSYLPSRPVRGPSADEARRTMTTQIERLTDAYTGASENDKPARLSAWRDAIDRAEKAGLFADQKGQNFLKKITATDNSLREAVQGILDQPLQSINKPEQPPTPL